MSATLPAAAASRAPRPVREGTFRTHDDVALFYRHWPAVGTHDTEGAGDGRSVRPRGAIVLLHRGHEHSGRVAHLADELALPDFDVFAWDARGHGRSPGPRGHSPSLADSVRDVGTFVRHIADAHGIAEEDVAVVAQSLGAVLAATWAHDYAPRVRCLVLASPAFRVKLYVPFARAGLRLLERVRGPYFVNSYVKARFLTHDPARIASYEADPLVTRPIASHVLLALYETAERVVADAAAITIPTQLLVSGDDWVVHRRPQAEFFARLGTACKEWHLLPGFYHDTLGERDRHLALAHVRRFVLARFDAPWGEGRPALLDADQAGPTHDEARRLAAPLPALSPRGLYWSATRLALRAGGRLSQGIALGHATGFDSGSTLDYVYRNQPAGAGPVGRAIDRTYLASIGWTGIRQRKRHLEELLQQAMADVAAAGLPVRLVDIAAGHGRYVLAAVAAAPARPEAVLLRDYSPLNVEAGRRLIAERGLEGVARFEQGDAFDEADLARLAPRPTLGVVSGLYELFPSNALVRRSLAGLAAAIPPGGRLVYTNQPWHPQLELIARALTSHRAGQAWVMRRRTQAEMDALVEAAGFRKREQRVDRWGIFTVSLAERRADG